MKKFFKAQPVLVISFLAAVLSMIAVPPDKEYCTYINRTVLIQLFALMAAVAGFRSAGIFERVTSLMLKRAGTLRRLGVVFVILCWISSMLVTNDVALLTFVPLTILIYTGIKDEKSRIITVVLETAAANMGSMLTPIGNPQNIYLYTAYKMTPAEFITTMLPTGLLSMGMILALTRLLPSTPLETHKQEEHHIKKKQAVAFSVLFVICLLSVLRLVPDWFCLIAAVVIAVCIDWKLLKKIDYALLTTFVCFFVFVGNIARIEPVKEMLSTILEGKELIVSALLSQLISNVPAAVMLSGFTGNGRELLLGVDIGGLGTIIASLASLISFQIYRQSEGAQPMRYMKYFSVIGFSMLAVMLGINIII